MRTAYASHSKTSRQMLCVWLDDRPRIGKEQRDPDAWTSQAPETDYAAKRLAELAKAPDVAITWIDPAAAEWWCKIEHGRRLKASKAERERTKDVQPPLLMIPPDIEEEGRRIGHDRKFTRMQGRR
jgi:hypothetical protein